MPLDDSDPRNSGPTNEEKLDALRRVKRLKRDVDEANGVYRAELKALKAAGHNTKALIAAMNAEKRDPDQVKADIRDTAHLLALRKVISFAELLAETDDLNVTHKAQQDDDQWDAEDKGYRAGRHGADRAENPYDAGSELAETWDRWWVKGQAAIANEMGPGAKTADASRARPKRGAAGDGGDEDEPKRGRGRPKGARNKLKGGAIPEVPTVVN